jgi:hypothetical protein
VGKTTSPAYAAKGERLDLSTTTADPELPFRSSLRGNRGTRLMLLNYQVAETRRIGSAAAKCSNQADLHLTFTDPIWPSDLPQRPSLTSMPLATGQTGASPIGGKGQQGSDNTAGCTREGNLGFDLLGPISLQSGGCQDLQVGDCPGG